MSRQTTNYGLTKPDYTDIADIEVVNANMDIIDEALKVIDTKAQNVMSKNSSAWSSTVTYAVGQYCIYNNSLWKCLVQHSGQTPQEGTYWTRVSLDTLGSEISAVNQNLSSLLQVKSQKLSIESIEANDDVTMQEQCATVSGYIPIGVVGTSTRYGGAIAVTRCALASNGDIVAQVKSGYASAVSNVWIEVYVLYVKSL